MYSLIERLLKIYPRRYATMAVAFNDRAAICDQLIESRVEGQIYTGLNGLVLTAYEKDSLIKLTSLFASIMSKAMGIIVTELSDTELEELGWPPSLAYALRHEPPNRWLTPIGRLDFGLDESGNWQLMEYNSDTPSGSQEVTDVEARLWKALRCCEGVARLNPLIGENMLEALHQEARFLPVPPGYASAEGPMRPPRVGFMVRGRYLTDLAQVMWYKRGLEARGLECVVGDPNNLSLVGNRIYLLGEPIDALYRLFPIEFLSQEPLFAAYLQANLTGALKCLNNLRGFLAQSKAIMAWVWHERDNYVLFTADERKAIYSSLPETYLLNALPPNFERGDYIIKEFYGREGAEVYNGAELSDSDWQEIRDYHTYIAQRRINLSAVPHAVVNLAREVQQTEVYPCVGSFVIGGDWGGCYTRVGGRITTAQAQFIPTLQEV
ncbi:glutathionylspermidine synthase family protein [Candidatus Chlorohelix sp.]|uniref:glutathionylspermidine synthase family protein n=1 Tax=Candidatus Chlorohelix sp. TaxID=3139201 RepID=UPI003071CBDE